VKTKTLDPAGLRMLQGLLGRTALQIVWDYNAVYVVGAGETVKIESSVGLATSPFTGAKEDVFPLKVSLAAENMAFKEEGEPGFGYWVVAVDEPVTKIEIVRLAIRFPDGPGPWEEVAPSSVDADAGDVELIDAGVFVHTPVGVLAAIPESWHAFGFRHESLPGSGPCVSLVDPPEAAALLPAEYELVPLPSGR
jgi:hypothetical protein